MIQMGIAVWSALEATMNTVPERRWPRALGGVLVLVALALCVAFVFMVRILSNFTLAGPADTLVRYNDALLLVVIVSWPIMVAAVIGAAWKRASGDVVVIALPVAWGILALIVTLRAVTLVPNTPRVEGAPSATVPAGAGPTQGVGDVGQTIVRGDVAIWLVSVRFDDSLPELPPRAGRAYVLVEIELENRSDGVLNIDVASFALRPGDPRPRRDAFEFDLMVDSGDPERGSLAFSYPADETELALTYHDPYLGEFRWRLFPPPTVTAVAPDRCTVAPRDPPGPVGSATPQVAHVWDIFEHANPRTAEGDKLDGIVTSVEEIVGCANSDDPARLAALVTDDFLRRHPELAHPPVRPTSGAASAGGLLRIVSVGEPLEAFIPASDLDERYVRVAVTLETSGSPGERVTTVLVLRLVGGRWLVDEVAGGPESDGAWLFAALAGDR